MALLALHGGCHAVVALHRALREALRGEAVAVVDGQAGQAVEARSAVAGEAGVVALEATGIHEVVEVALQARAHWRIQVAIVAAKEKKAIR